jgi:hypothetical protein
VGGSYVVASVVEMPRIPALEVASVYLEPADRQLRSNADTIFDRNHISATVFTVSAIRKSECTPARFKASNRHRMVPLLGRKELAD